MKEKNVIFGKEYIKKFCVKNGYEQLQNQKQFMQFAYPHNNFEFSYNLRTDKFDKQKVFFTSGIGMNKEPHLLTLMQLVNMLNIQKLGFKTQIVLGDFDVMLARGSADAFACAERYKRFLKAIGFDDRAGIIRTQSEYDFASRNAILLSAFLNFDDFDFVKEDIINFYKPQHQQFDYATMVSISLMLSDFLSPILGGEYLHTVVCCGIDESKYAVLANKLAEKMNYGPCIGGLFTGVVKGFNGHPKMSKSKPDSCIFLSDSKEKVQALIQGEAPSLDSVQFALAKFLLSQNELPFEKICDAYQTGDLVEIKNIQNKLIDKITWYCSCWQNST